MASLSATQPPPPPPPSLSLSVPNKFDTTFNEIFGQAITGYHSLSELEHFKTTARNDPRMVFAPPTSSPPTSSPPTSSTPDSKFFGTVQTLSAVAALASEVCVETMFHDIMNAAETAGVITVDSNGNITFKIPDAEVYYKIF